MGISQKNVILGGRTCFFFFLISFLSHPCPFNPLTTTQIYLPPCCVGNYWSTPRCCSRNSCSLVRKTNICECIISCAPKHIKHRGDKCLFTAELTAQTKSYHLSFICPSIHLYLCSVTSSPLSTDRPLLGSLLHPLPPFTTDPTAGVSENCYCLSIMD